MNEEMSARLAQELLDAADDDARARVVVHWLPDFARCQVATAGRVKQLVAAVDALGRKMDAYHTAAGNHEGTHAAPAKAKAPALARLEGALALLKANWQWLLLFALVAKAYGLVDFLKALFALGGGQ